MARKTSVLECQGCGSEYEAKRTDSKWCPACRGPRHAIRIAAAESARYHPCLNCQRLCARKALRCRVCSNRLRGQQTKGDRSSSWKGGRVFRKRDGYWELRIDGERILEHRYVWEQAHGPLPKNWVVHHLNGIKDDNRIENLVGMARSHHGPRAHIDPSEYEARIRTLEARIRELEG